MESQSLPPITMRYVCDLWIGDMTIWREPVELPDAALDITMFKWPKRPTNYCQPFNPVLRPALHENCNEIWRTLDDKYWLIFPSEEEAALFKLSCP